MRLLLFLRSKYPQPLLDRRTTDKLDQLKIYMSTDKILTRRALCTILAVYITTILEFTLFNSIKELFNNTTLIKDKTSSFDLLCILDSTFYFFFFFLTRPGSTSKILIHRCNTYPYETGKYPTNFLRRL